MRHPLDIYKKMEKIMIHIVIILSLSFIKTAAQSNDSTGWVNYTNDSLGISFIYPSYFELNPFNYAKRHNCAAYIEYVWYSPVDENVDSNKAIYLELYSTLKVYLSNCSFNKIAEENSFIRKGSNWYSEDNYYEDPADTFYISNWKGLRSVKNTSIGIKGGGIWTSAGEKEVFLLIKVIGNNKSIVCYAEGFDFPKGESILKNICNSINYYHK